MLAWIYIYIYIYIWVRESWKEKGLLCSHSELLYKLQSLAARHAELIAKFLAVSTRNAFCSWEVILKYFVGLYLTIDVGLYLTIDVGTWRHKTERQEEGTWHTDLLFWLVDDLMNVLLCCVRVTWALLRIVIAVVSYWICKGYACCESLLLNPPLHLDTLLT